jgi:signal transduction histidine kinase
MLTLGVLAVNAVLLSGLAVAGVRNRSEPGASVFAVLEGVSAVWVAATIAELTVQSPGVRVRMWGLSTGLSLVAVPLWLAFILRYTGRDRWLRPDRFAVVATPLLVGASLYLFVPTWPGLIAETSVSTLPSGTVVSSSIGPVGAALGVYVYLLFASGLWLVVETVASGNRVFVGQAMAFLAGSLLTVLASLGEVFGVAGAGYPLTETALGAQAALWGFAVFRQQFLAVVPAVARVGERVVFDEIDDGVVVVDDEGTVTRVNPQAQSYLGGDLGGATTADLLDRIEAPSLEALPTRVQRTGRTYQVKASELTDWRGQTIGRALVVRDITGLVRRQQRLQVLNRIMRHNLRNDMTVIRGYAEGIGRQVNGDVSEMSTTIVRRANNLLDVSEKAVEINSILDRDAHVETVDVESAVGEWADHFEAEYSSADIEVRTESGELRTTPELLSVVLREVVENAIQHGGDPPHVEIEASVDSEEAVFSVTDDGSGIPAVEVDAIRAGTEQPLEHATSLGLWLSYWGALTLGGDIDFSVSETGTCVTVVVPQLPASEVGGSIDEIETVGGY